MSIKLSACYIYENPTKRFLFLSESKFAGKEFDENRAAKQEYYTLCQNLISIKFYFT